MLEWAVGGALAWAQALAPAIVPAATKATANLAAATRRFTLSAIQSSPTIAQLFRIGPTVCPGRPSVNETFVGEGGTAGRQLKRPT